MIRITTVFFCIFHTFRAKILEEDPTNRFSIGEAFLVQNKNNTETVIVPESVLETPPPPPPSSPPPAPKPSSLEATLECPKIEIIAPSLAKPSVNCSNEAPPPQTEKVLELQPVSTQSLDPAKYCKLCDISVTSEMHMRLHLAGAKHAKKLRQLGEPPHTEEPHTISQCIQEDPISIRLAKAAANVNAVKSVAAAAGAAPLAAIATSHIDYSVFRTPSGQYYCQVCDLSVTSEVTLSQHFASKRHLKTTKRK